MVRNTYCKSCAPLYEENRKLYKLSVENGEYNQIWNYISLYDFENNFVKVATARGKCYDVFKFRAYCFFMATI